MKCKQFKSIESTIHVANVGDFCLDCHNDYTAELLGVSNAYGPACRCFTKLDK